MTAAVKADGTRPQALQVQVDNIPAVLRDSPRWVLWRYVGDADRKTGEIDWDKPPVNARTGGLASSTNSGTWSSYGDAYAAFCRGGLDGLGFVLHAEPGDSAAIVGIDLDKCRDIVTGTAEPWAQEIIRTVSSYTEVSPSGRGIRIFLRGKLPKRGRKKGHYENYETGRYVTVTGQHVEGTPRTVENRQAELLAVHRAIFGDVSEPERQPAASGGLPASLDDAELVRRAGEMGNGAGARFRKLWAGDTSDQGNDHSRADLALCSYLAFFCGPNENRISELFGQSGLFRSKWNRDDYRQRTIARALKGRTEYYSPHKNGNGHARAPRSKPDRESLPPGEEPASEFDDRLPAESLATQRAATDAAADPENGGAQAEDSFHLTDEGNAQRVVKRHGRDMRFCHAWKTWLVYDGGRWKEDATAESVRRVKDTVASLYRWACAKLAEERAAAGGEDEEDEDGGRKKRVKQLTGLISHCFKWEDARSIMRSLQLAASEPTIPILPDQLDADPFALNCLNGTLDLRTGQLREHRREDCLTKLCPVEYRPDATCPAWERFLLQVMDGNRDLTSYLQRVIGYSLTGDVREQALWFLHGSGANGKSTFLGAVLDVLGDYGVQAVSDLLLAKRNESHPTERADLFGRRFVATIEVDQGRCMAEALMKQLTGGDRVKARKMRQDFFEFTPTWKIFLAANHKPVIRGTDLAAWRRIKLVPFTVTIAPEAQDKTLPEKLRAERPGILAWAVRGCLEWQRHGLGEPEEVKIATDAYRSEQDTLEAFIGACCVSGAHAKVQASALLMAYERWSGDKVTAKAFARMLEEKNYTSKRGHGGWIFYQGIGLQATENEDTGEGW